MILLSLNETRAFAHKASCGAGYRWGVAEEAAMATEWLARRGIDGLGILAAWLEHRSRMGSGPAACPIETGIAFCDLPPASPRALGTVAAPVLLLPFVDALAARTGRRPGLAAPGGEWLAPPELMGRGPRGVQIVLLADGAPPDLPVRDARVGVAARDLATLEAFARETTVPLSAHSRGDAGAGLLDND